MLRRSVEIRTVLEPLTDFSLSEIHIFPLACRDSANQVFHRLDNTQSYRAQAYKLCPDQ